jgi:acetyltransferase-like isoleucine patch superfamily enzyme
VHETVTVWAGSQIRENSVIGKDTTIGQYCYVGPGVIIGDRCKVQNQALIYEPAIIGNGVFIGPRVVITNDLNPRAINVDGTPKRAEDWIARAAQIGDGASLGAGVICVGPVTIGSWAMAAAGAVITKDVPSHALVAGVPARQIGWVGVLGYKLTQHGDQFICPISGARYVFSSGGELSAVLD